MVPDPLSTRVLTRWNVCARWKGADSIGDPKALLTQFDKALEVYSNPPDLHGFTPGLVYAHKIVRGFELIQHHGAGGRLFLAILQQFSLPAPLRKQIEAAAKFWAKSRTVKPKPEVAQEVYQKTLTLYREQAQTAIYAINQGKAHSEEGAPEALRAGPFKLVNTGGFDEKTMTQVQGIVEKAAHLIQAAGQGKVLYGDIHVSNTLSKSTVLAFYMPDKDEMFVRANLKGQEKGAVHTIIHELGHRLEEKVSKKGINTLFYVYSHSNGGETVVRDPSIPAPEPGAEIKSGRQLWQVERVDSQKVYLIADDDPKQGASMSIDGWYLTHGAKRTGGKFVSQYAKKSASENFAEMFAHYCLGTLSPEQTEDLEKIIK